MWRLDRCTCHIAVRGWNSEQMYLPSSTRSNRRRRQIASSIHEASSVMNWSRKRPGISTSRYRPDTPSSSSRSQPRDCDGSNWCRSGVAPISGPTNAFHAKQWLRRSLIDLAAVSELLARTYPRPIERARLAPWPICRHRRIAWKGGTQTRKGAGGCAGGAVSAGRTTS